MEYNGERNSGYAVIRMYPHFYLGSLPLVRYFAESLVFYFDVQAQIRYHCCGKVKEAGN